MDKWNLNRMQAVVFDFDGVILDSAEIKTHAFLELFSEWPEHTYAIGQYHFENQGISRFKKFRWIFENLIRQPLSADHEITLGSRFSDLVFDQIKCAPFVPGALELLRFLSSHSIPAFIASGTPQEELEEIVRIRELGSLFRSVYGTPTTKEIIVNQILMDLDLESESVLFIGDAITDYNAAKHCRVNFLARSTPNMVEFWKQHNVVTTENLEEAIAAYVW